MAGIEFHVKLDVGIFVTLEVLQLGTVATVDVERRELRFDHFYRVSCLLVARNKEDLLPGVGSSLQSIKE
jgi:hypothetical protein